MGVAGLKTFVSQHAQNHSVDLHELTDLQGTTLVVDGNNILYPLYFESSADTSYGGDYDVFAKDVQTFCNSLTSAKITPYFIFDGTSEPDDRKLEKKLKRAKESISEASKRTDKILPCLAYKVFIEKLKELKIPYCVCDHEADGQLASLAYQWNCPLVSNDGDFLLHNLPAGVISVDDFGIQNLMSNSTSTSPPQLRKIPLFKASKLCEHYNVKLSVLPLLSVICGNDFFQPSQLTKFRLRSLKEGTRSAGIPEYLKWLAKYVDIEGAINEIVTIEGSSTAEDLRRNIMDALKAYKPSPNHISNYLKLEKIYHYGDHYLHTELPLELWKRYRKADIFKTFIEVLVHRRRIFHVQMEKLDNPSSWIISRSIRTQAYQILSSTIRGEIKQVKEFDRINKALVPKDIDVDKDKVDFSLHKLYSTSEVERLELFYSALGITSADLDSGIVDPASDSRRDNDILSAVIVYWIRNSQPQVCKTHVMAIILACVIGLTSESTSPSQQKSLDILHAMAQFQCVLSDGLDLLGLLAVDLNIQIREIFSGHDIYSLYVDLSSKEDPMRYCDEFLPPDMMTSFKRRYKAIEAVCTGHLRPQKNIPAKKQKAKKKTKAASRDGAASARPKSTTGAFGNRFAALSLE